MFKQLIAIAAVCIASTQAGFADDVKKLPKVQFTAPIVRNENVETYDHVMQAELEKPE